MRESGGTLGFSLISARQQVNPSSADRFNLESLSTTKEDNASHDSLHSCTSEAPSGRNVKSESPYGFAKQDAMERNSAV